MSKITLAYILAGAATAIMIVIGAANAVSNAAPAATGCDLTNAVTGPPSGGMFAGRTFQGHGQTLPAAGYTAGTDTCITGYVFSGSRLALTHGAANVTITNNTFQDTSAITGVLAATSNITVSYNTFRNNHGSISDGAIEGIGGTTTNLTITHNDVEGTATGQDGMHLQCFTAPCANIDISYNRFVGIGRYGFELQGLVHGEKITRNYVTMIYNAAGDRTGGGGGGQISISNTGEQNGTFTGTQSSTGIEFADNVLIQDRTRGACFEMAGSGSVAHGNYCKNYSILTDWKDTNDNCAGVPWTLTGNIIVGATAATGLAQPQVAGGRVWNNPRCGATAPTEVGNRQFAVGDPAAPGLPAWPYKAGVQPTTPDLSAVGPPNPVSTPNRTGPLPEHPGGTPTADTPTIPTATDTTTPRGAPIRPNFLPMPLPSAASECVPS